MHIQTKYFGEMNVDKGSFIQFPDGLPGFPDEKQFVLLNLSEKSIYQVLQSVENPAIAFVVVNPYDIYQDYVIDLDDNLIDTLQITDKRDVVVMSIVTLKDPFESSTINLKAPIIIHSRTSQGKQYILHTDEYPTKASILPPASSCVKGE
ncbi:flagellar assembly protein FliW [Lentibacillus lipolyticus]|nr:flagellar assembly protein FliW [Lentibacillus lipolyticus]